MFWELFSDFLDLIGGMNLPTRLPGRPEGPKISCKFIKDSPSLRRISARAATPIMGLLSSTWSPRDKMSTLIFRKASPSTSQPISHRNKSKRLPLTVCLTDESWPAKSPFKNMCRAATAIPSLRFRVRPLWASLNFQKSPAPASKRTETKKRSISLRVFSVVSHFSSSHSARRVAMRGTPPTSKCCQRP